MEQLFNLRLQAQFTVQAVKKFGLAGLFVKFDAGERRQVLGKRLAQLAGFDQAGVCVTGESPFGRRSQLHKKRVMLGQEIEIC